MIELVRGLVPLLNVGPERGDDVRIDLVVDCEMPSKRIVQVRV